MVVTLKSLYHNTEYSMAEAYTY